MSEVSYPRTSEDERIGQVRSLEKLWMIGVLTASIWPIPGWIGRLQMSEVALAQINGTGELPSLQRTATTMLGLWIILGLILAVIVFKWGRLATQLIILDGEGRFSARPKVVALGLSVPVINALTCPLALAWLMRAGSASRNISQAEIIGRISLLGFLTVALLGWGFNYLSGPRMQLMLSAGFSTSMMVALEHVSLYAAMAGAWILTRKVIEDAKVRVDQMPQKAENSQADE